MGSWLLAGVLALFVAPPNRPAQAGTDIVDRDRDGVDDALEAALLERFRPTFLVSGIDCDQLPAEFAPALPESFSRLGAPPRAVARNGTIYGQVFGRGTSGGDELIEAHYYHLWTRDCGARGHDLDAEHVSVLLTAASASSPAADWSARAWYAAAHQETMCDASRFVPAEQLDAVQRGAKVWISSDKHASYLTAESCGGGCGKDRCEAMVALDATRVINLGEANAPMNGAGWIASPRWALAQKMTSDFPDGLLAAGAAGPEAPFSRRSAQAVIGAGAAAQKHSGSALNTAGEHAAHGMDAGKAKSGNAVRRALGATGRFLRLTRPNSEPPATPLPQ